jgi:hypothetical protein
VLPQSGFLIYAETMELKTVFRKMLIGIQDFEDFSSSPPRKFYWLI